MWAYGISGAALSRCARALGRGGQIVSMAKRRIRAKRVGKKSRVPITLEQNGATSSIHMDGEVTVANAAELKLMLVQALKEGKNVRLDLESATDMDITALQLLWAAHREAKKTGVTFFTAGRVPEELSAAAVEAGLEGFPVPADASGSSLPRPFPEE